MYMEMVEEEDKKLAESWQADADGILIFVCLYLLVPCVTYSSVIDWSILCRRCNGHYNRMPDLGKCVMWWNTWDLARHMILDTKVLDRNVTWLTKHKDTS